MALLERLAILITADAAGAISEMKKVAASAEKDLGKAGDEGSKLSRNMTKAGAAMIGAGAGLLAVGVAAADTATSLGREVMKLQRYTGLTAEEASKLAFAAKMSGVPVDSLATGLGKLSKAMEANSPAFDKLGVSARDSNGKLRTMGDVLPDLAEKFKSMPNGPEKTATALQLFGRAGMDLMPFLNKGREGIKQLSDEAEKMGLVLSQDNIGAIKDHIASQRELNAAFDGVKTQIGLSMIPVLDTMTDAFKNIPGPVYDVIGPLTVFGGLGLTAAGGISLIVGQLKNLQTYAVTAFSGMKNLFSQLSGAPMAFGAAAAAIAVLAAGIYLYQKRLSDAGAAGVKALGDLSGKSTDELKTNLDEVNAKLEKLKKEMAVDSPTNGLGKLWDVLTGKDKDKAALEKQKQALEDAIASAGNAVGPTKTLAEAEKAAADETTNHALAVKILNDTLNASLDPFLNSISATEKVAESERKLTESKQKVFFAQLALTEAIKQHGPNSVEAAKAADDLAEAQRGVDAAQSASFKSAIEYEQSIGNLKAQMADHPEIYQQNIDKINAMEAAQQIDTETAERMRKKLQEVAIAAGAIPPSASVKVTADTWDAAWKITDLVTRIETLNRLAHTPGSYNYSSLNNAMGGRVGPGMAMGGRPSRPVLTGELGPEIFWPDTAGTIVTAEKTKQMLSSSGGGNTAVYNINVNVAATADKAAIGQSIVESIAAYERRSGDGWRS